MPFPLINDSDAKLFLDANCCEGSASVFKYMSEKFPWSNCLNLHLPSCWWEHFLLSLMRYVPGFNLANTRVWDFDAKPTALQTLHFALKCTITIQFQNLRCTSKSKIKLRHISWEAAFFLENSWVSGQTRAQRTFLWLNISQTSNLRNWLIWSNTSIQWPLINFSRKLGSDFIATLYNPQPIFRGGRQEKTGLERVWSCLNYVVSPLFSTRSAIFYCPLFTCPVLPGSLLCWLISFVLDDIPQNQTCILYLVSFLGKFEWFFLCM